MIIQPPKPRLATTSVIDRTETFPPDMAPAARPGLRPGGENSVVTRMTFPFPAAALWEELMFYEQIGERPPFVLRLLLPTPVRTEGRGAAAGTVVKCQYLGGHLLKRITEAEPARRYGFEVVEQTIRVGHGIRLLGGSYVMRDLPEECAEISLTTRYSSPHRPRWLWAPLEAAVCHLFHRYILSAMRHGIDSR